MEIYTVETFQLTEALINRKKILSNMMTLQLLSVYELQGEGQMVVRVVVFGGKGQGRIYLRLILGLCPEDKLN